YSYATMKTPVHLAGRRSPKVSCQMSPHELLSVAFGKMKNHNKANGFFKDPEADKHDTMQEKLDFTALLDAIEQINCKQNPREKREATEELPNNNDADHSISNPVKQRLVKLFNPYNTAQRERVHEAVMAFHNMKDKIRQQIETQSKENSNRFPSNYLGGPGDLHRAPPAVNSSVPSQPTMATPVKTPSPKATNGSLSTIVPNGAPPSNLTNGTTSTTLPDDGTPSLEPVEPPAAGKSLTTAALKTTSSKNNSELQSPIQQQTSPQNEQHINTSTTQNNQSKSSGNITIAQLSALLDTTLNALSSSTQHEPSTTRTTIEDFADDEHTPSEFTHALDNNMDDPYMGKVPSEMMRPFYNMALASVAAAFLLVQILTSPSLMVNTQDSVDNSAGAAAVLSTPQPVIDTKKPGLRQVPPSNYDFEAEKAALEYAKGKNLAMVMKTVPNIKFFDFDDGTSEGTLLHYAAFHGWTNLMDIIIKQKGLSPVLENNYDKRTPLLSACRGGRLDSVKYCIKSLKKAEWSAANENGLTCSHFAAREGHPEVLSYMIELNKLADIPLSAQSHKVDRKLKWTPLHYAANNGHSECAIILLLEAGANPYKRGFRMQSAIDLARARGDKALVDIMHDPLKFKITSLIEASLGSERKAREKAITALREEILKLKEALASAGPEGENAAGLEPGGAPAMMPSHAVPPGGGSRRRRSVPSVVVPPVEPVVKRDIRNFQGFGSMNMHRCIGASSEEKCGLSNMAAATGVIKEVHSAVDSENETNVTNKPGDPLGVEMESSTQKSSEDLIAALFSNTVGPGVRFAKVPQQLKNAKKLADTSDTFAQEALAWAESQDKVSLLQLLGNVTDLEADDHSPQGTIAHYAAFHGWLDILDLVAHRDTNVLNLKNSFDNSTPLLLACQSGKLDAVKFCAQQMVYLLDATENSKGQTCAHLAAKTGHSEVISFMVKKNKQMGLADDFRRQLIQPDKDLSWTPVHYAADNGHQEAALVLLLEAGDNQYFLGKNGENAVDAAAKKKNNELVSLLEDPLTFKIQQVIQNASGKQFQNPESVAELVAKLEQATLDEDDIQSLHHIRQAELKPSQVIEPQSRDDAQAVLIESKGQNPAPEEVQHEILRLAKARNLSGVNELLARFTSPTFDDGGTEGTLAHYAAYNNWLPLLKRLVKEKGVSPEVKNQWDNRSPYLSACCGGSMEVVRYYIEDLGYPKWKEGNDNGMTCAHFAAREDHHRMLSYLLQLWKQEAGGLQFGPVLPPDVESWLPLHYAANNGHKEATIILMLEGMADPYRRNKEHKSALDIAKERGDKELIEIMIDPIKYKILALVDGALQPFKKFIDGNPSSAHEMRPSRDTAVKTQVAALNASLHWSHENVKEDLTKLKLDFEDRFGQLGKAISNQAAGLKSLQESASQKLQELAQFVKVKAKITANAGDIKHKAMESDFLAFRDLVESEILRIKAKVDTVASKLDNSADELKKETDKESHNIEVVKKEFPRLWGHLDQLRKDLKKLEEKLPHSLESIKSD
ncbi:unnamed protein product, partial [Notodromas monacha]